MKNRRLFILCVLLLLVLLAIPFRTQVRHGIALAAGKKKSVSNRLRQYGPPARERLRPHFRRAGVAYLPREVVLVGLKREAVLQVYAAGKDGKMSFIRAYPIRCASGELGPKLREGDCQVPEGLYRVDWLNPNSSYHLSLHLTYPNAFDRRMGKRDKREKLGGDIMIHGADVSIVVAWPWATRRQRTCSCSLLTPAFRTTASSSAH